MAIEDYLRGFGIDVGITAAPHDRDSVDYFLFDLQRGFCDYYASAMVVMARAVGLPARLGVGFLQRPPDAAGAQTIRQIDAHSWAEVYFAGYGWVEFEPTAPFSAAPAPETAVVPSQATYTPPQPAAVAIPPRAPRRGNPWLLLLGLAALGLVIWRLWGRHMAVHRQQRDELDEVQRAFAGLLDGAAAIGHPARPAAPASSLSRAMPVRRRRDGPRQRSNPRRPGPA